MNLQWFLVGLISTALSAGSWAQSQKNSTENDICNFGRWGNWITLERQVAIGRSVVVDIESHVKFVSDPVITEYVNGIAQKLARNSGAKVPIASRSSTQVR